MPIILYVLRQCISFANVCAKLSQREKERDQFYLCRSRWVAIDSSPNAGRRGGNTSALVDRPIWVILYECSSTIEEIGYQGLPGP